MSGPDSQQDAAAQAHQVTKGAAATDPVQDTMEPAAVQDQEAVEAEMDPSAAAAYDANDAQGEGEGEGQAGEYGDNYYQPQGVCVCVCVCVCVLLWRSGSAAPVLLAPVLAHTSQDPLEHTHPLCPDSAFTTQRASTSTHTHSLTRALWPHSSLAHSHAVLRLFPWPQTQRANTSTRPKTATTRQGLARGPLRGAMPMPPTQ